VTPLLLAVLLSLPARAEHGAGGGDAAVVSAAQGAYLYSAQPGNYAGSLVLRRVSPDGGLYWSENYGRNQGEEATALAVSADGGAVLAGAKTKGCFAARWDGSGRLVWEIGPEPYGQCRPAAAVSDAEGTSYLLVSVSNGGGGFDAVVLAFDGRGEQRWRWRYPASDTVYARNLVLDPKGDRLRGYVLRRSGTEFVEEFFRLDLDGRRLDR
jgi:outer membrane protein assembly factor BamB